MSALKQSAGIVLYRESADGVAVVLVHASGPYNKKSPWNLPKGEPDAGESLEQTARREVKEEIDVVVDGPLIPLGFCDYKKSKKRVHAFLAPLPDGAQPRCASWEIDKAELLPLAQARALLHPDLVPFLDRLEIELLKQKKQKG